MTIGRLTLVATPIGNLGDLSPRAVDVLAAADAIVCEDTRRTGRLLQHAGVTPKRFIVANEHTEASAAHTVTDLLATGAHVAVVTDAGMPGIADPGERLVRAALDLGATVSVVPGPTAAASALSISGIAGDRYVSEGFLPRHGAERSERITEIAAERRTVVLYEAPHRIVRLLDELIATCDPDRPVALVRELTKLHEEAWRGTISTARVHVGLVEPRGEYVVVLAGRTSEVVDLDGAINAELAAGRRPSDAAAAVAQALGIPKRAAYSRALELARTRESDHPRQTGAT